MCCRGSQLAPTPAETTNHIPSSNWPVSFRRPNVLKRKDEWTHIYSFNKQDRKERLKTISTGTEKTQLGYRNYRPFPSVYEQEFESFVCWYPTVSPVTFILH